MLLDTIAKNAAALDQLGPEAIERANRLGVAAYYQDDETGPGYIKEYPDGRRERVALHNLHEVSLGPATPRR